VQSSPISTSLPPSALDTVTSADLRDEPVSHCGEDAAAVGGECPALQELSLVHTLLSDWAEVGRIASALPSLTSLHLRSAYGCMGVCVCVCVCGVRAYFVPPCMYMSRESCLTLRGSENLFTRPAVVPSGLDHLVTLVLNAAAIDWAEVSARAGTHIHTYIHTHTHTYV
jgi:hypothetical protein